MRHGSCVCDCWVAHDLRVYFLNNNAQNLLVARDFIRASKILFNLIYIYFLLLLLLLYVAALGIV